MMIVDDRERRLLTMTDWNSAQWLQRAADIMYVGVLIVDDVGIIRYANHAAHAWMGYDHQELSTCTIRDILDNDALGFANGLDEHLRAGPIQRTIDFKMRSGKVKRGIIEAFPVTNDRQVATCILLRELHEPFVHRDSPDDELTGLISRTRFLKQVTHDVSYRLYNTEHTPDIALLLIDIDRLSTINGSYGYHVGDAILIEVARRLGDMTSCRGLSRMGGDEFGMLIQISQTENLTCVVDDIFRTLREPMTLSDQELFVTVSGGLRSVEGCPTAQELLEQAGLALYHAKEFGGDSYQLYDPVMAPHDSMEMEKRLHKALINDEFLLYYQPQFDIATGQMTGMEVLLRWNNVDLGLVLPSLFIPIAERTGMIVPIGKWVLTEACRQRQVWVQEGYTFFRIAVNLSARQFQQPDLAQMISTILNETGLNPELLELEITESIAMTNVSQAYKTLQELEQLGVRVSIDDFGTGYSSLGYLRRFPIQTLKIDQSFMRDIPNVADGIAITRAIISLAHSLRLRVIAEGVETKEQLDFLYEHDCDEMQGFLLSRPLTLSAADTFVKENGCG